MDEQDQKQESSSVVQEVEIVQSSNPPGKRKVDQNKQKDLKRQANIQITGDPREQSTSPPLSKFAMIASFALAFVIVLVSLSALFSPKPAVSLPGFMTGEDKPAKQQPETKFVSAKEITDKAPPGLIVEARTPEGPPHETPTIAPNGQDTTGVNNTAANNSAQDMAETYRLQMEMQLQMQREQEKARLEAERRAEMKRIYEAPSTVYVNEAIQHNNRPMNPAEPYQGDSVLPATNGLDSSQALKGRLSNLEASSYLQHTRMAPVSPYELKAGTVIPSVMISGINSDLPGQLIAQVASNVYDTATGKYLLIPQGARLVGTYDHGINQGQKRVLIAWNRIIYPDASSLNLEAMSGQDQGGYAGFKDRTNNHTLSRMGEAIFLSALTAGVQLSQPRAKQGDLYSPQQVIAGSLGMQMNQMGMMSYQSRMNQAPTITVRPGYRFNVMVSKDIVMPPWEGSTRHGNSPLRSASRW